jgi:cytochrome b involved in lipid metabolism
VLAPEPATPSSSENASDSEEEATIGPNRVYNPKYVRKHNTRRDLLVIIGLKVYDLSSFVDEHPYANQSLSMNSIMFLTKC